MNETQISFLLVILLVFILGEFMSLAEVWTQNWGGGKEGYESMHYSLKPIQK